MAKLSTTPTADSCNERHKYVNWAIGTFVALLGSILVVNCMAISMVREASAKADTAVNRVEVQTALTTQQRERSKEDIADVKERIRVMGDKVDRMNDSVQRLIQQGETGKK